MTSELENLFGKTGKDYRNIKESDMFHTKIVGVTFEGRQEVIKKCCKEDDSLMLVRERDNKYDANAVAVYADTSDYLDEGHKLSSQIGYLNKDLAAEIAPIMDSGISYKCVIENITGGSDGMSYGVNVMVVKASDYRFVSTQLQVLKSLDGQKIYYDPAKHEYYDNDNGKLTSASNIAHLFIDDTGIERAKIGTAKKAGISVEKVEEMWNDMGEKSREWGNAVHATIGSYLKWKDVHKETYGTDERLIPKNPILKKVLNKFLETVDLEDKELLVEQLVASKDYNICGRFDLFAIGDENVLYDFKTNDDLDAKVKIKAPLDRMFEENQIGVYGVQLSAYAMMLRDAGLKVDKAYIVSVKLDNECEPMVELREVKLKDIGLVLADNNLKKGK